MRVGDADPPRAYRASRWDGLMLCSATEDGMSRSAYQRRLAFKLPAWRLTLLLFVCLAFSLQSYTAQTHIHFPPASASSFSNDATFAGKSNKAQERQPVPDKFPGNDDPAKCPLCQVVAHGGQYVWPTSIILSLPDLPATVVPVAVSVLRLVERDSHSWQSRAPPAL
jgi:hypothetical protein